jgi:hypothetical protein
MSDFENYPYNEQHELNLDPTLKDLKEDKTTAENANKRVDGVEDTINNDNEKLDDANAKADAINQNADNFVDQSNTRINDIENNSDNSVNNINKSADGISDKADDLNKKINDNSDKVDNINNKQNETKEQVDNSVSNAYYENELTPEEMTSAKKMGVLKVEKASGITSNEISTVTPSGALGNCVVWSSSPFTFINTNPQILTDQDFSGDKIIQYQCAGSFLIFRTFDKTNPATFGSNGHSVKTDKIRQILTTNNHLDIYTSDDTEKYTVILPKTDPHTWDKGYEQFTGVKDSNSTLTTKQNLLSNHVYVYAAWTISGYVYVTNTELDGYIYNNTATIIKENATNASLPLVGEYSNNTFNLKTGTKGDIPDEGIEVRLQFVDLGEM